MSRLIGKQPNCERKRLTRCVWRRNHCGLSLKVLQIGPLQFIKGITTPFQLLDMVTYMHALTVIGKDLINATFVSPMNVNISNIKYPVTISYVMI